MACMQVATHGLTARGIPVRRAGRKHTIVSQKDYVRVPSNYRPKEKKVDGNDWFSVTKRAALSVSESPGQADYDKRMEERRKAVKRYVDREDLYAGNWEGSRYVGSRFNVLNVLLLVAIGTPLVGLLFAYLTYGQLWG